MSVLLALFACGSPPQVALQEASAQALVDTGKKDEELPVPLLEPPFLEPQLAAFEESLEASMVELAQAELEQLEAEVEQLEEEVELLTPIESMNADTDTETVKELAKQAEEARESLDGLRCFLLHKKEYDEGKAPNWVQPEFSEYEASKDPCSLLPGFSDPKKLVIELRKEAVLDRAKRKLEEKLEQQQVEQKSAETDTPVEATAEEK